MRGSMRIRWDTHGGKRHGTGQSWRSENKLVYLIILQKAKPFWWARNNIALIQAIEENPNLISEIPLY